MKLPELTQMMTCDSRIRSGMLIRRARTGLLTALAVTALFAGASPAQASIITWTLSGVTLSGGGAVTGSFDYNTSTDAYSNINISAAANSTYSAATFTVLDCSNCSGGGDYGFNISQAGTSSLTSMFLNWAGLLPAGGGTVSLDTGNSAEDQCTDISCVSFTAPMVAITAGSIVSPMASSVPEPSSFVLLAAGLVGLLLVFRWNRNKTEA